MRLVKRRIFNSLLSTLLTVVLLIILDIYGTPVYRMQIWSGWILFSLIIFLLFYNVRKKFTMLPLGRAAFWMQCHAYLGLVSCVMFLQHVNFRIPNGYFESLFALAFILTAVTGIMGLVLSRVIPKFLTRRGEEVIFERIPSYTANIREQAQLLIVDCAKTTKSEVLFEYYQEHLVNYFLGPKNVFHHLSGSTTPWHHMLIKHQTFGRFLSGNEKEYADQLQILMKQKDDLDFHYALQGILKAWPFLHLPMSFALLIFSLLHLVLVYAFTGGI
jgi:hypothetical protein